uniref:TPM domain-containing protein n=1 Tax=Flavobacterium sp. TaxID=239 RepID=UPI00404A58AB
MMLLSKYKTAFCLVFLCLFQAFAFGQIPEKPSEQKGVYEFGVDVLSNAESNRLEQKLKSYADSTSTQIVVIFLSTTQGNDINMFTAELGEKWGIGQKGKNNGILIVAAIDDRKVSIQNGYGAEYLMTDALSKRIIEQIIKPNFKNQNYYQGIDEATTAIMQIMAGEYKNDVSKKSNKLPFFIIIVAFIFIMALINKNKNGRNGGNRGMNGPSLAEIILLSSLSRGGGGFGGSSGGGGFGGGGFSGGFGGGSFGGGGASGSW